MDSSEERKEVIPGYFVGDTVLLYEHTENTKSLTLGTVGVVSENDNEETLKGWKVVNYEKKIKEVLDEKTPEEIKEIFNRLVDIGKINAPKMDAEKTNNNEKDDNGNID
jgi:hypothetical protein